MRLIDADALKKEVENFQNCYNGWSDTYDKAFIIGAIKEQPSIDIVRCKECKYEPICSHSVQHTTRDAHSVTIGYKSVDFCSYGEREGE